MGKNKTRSIDSAPRGAVSMNVRVPRKVHARLIQECDRLAQELGGHVSLSMLFTRLGNQLPEVPEAPPVTNRRQPPARERAAVVRARSA